MKPPTSEGWCRKNTKKYKCFNCLLKNAKEKSAQTQETGVTRLGCWPVGCWPEWQDGRNFQLYSTKESQRTFIAHTRITLTPINIITTPFPAEANHISHIRQNHTHTPFPRNQITYYISYRTRKTSRQPGKQADNKVTVDANHCPTFHTCHT